MTAINPNKLPRYTTVIFDVDGTIMDTADADIKAMDEAIFTVTGLHYPEEEMRKGLGMPGIESMRRLGVPSPDECNELHKKLFPNYQLEFTHIFPEIEAVLAKLAERGITLGIVTSRDHHEFYNDPLMTAEFQAKFGAIVIADMTELHKPNGEPLEKGMELLNAQPETTLYIGDSAHDFGCATACGVDFALATWGAHWDIPESTYRPNTPLDILNFLD